MASKADSNPKYWQEYSNLQRVKHDLIRQYLGGWFAKLGSWAGRVLYFDTHAGRGAHTTGHVGSPLVALRTLLDHSHRHRLLQRSEFRFQFIERDGDNLRALDEEVRQLGPLPKNVYVDSYCEDCFSHLEAVVSSLRETGSRMAPAFVFVDPYGFKVPGAILRRLMAAGAVELFITVIWRELDMAIVQGRTGEAPGLAASLDEIFDTADWRVHIDATDFDERAGQCVDLLAETISAKWATRLRMLGDNRKTRYMLLHLTNHDEGRKLMKDCMWAVAPDGGFYAGKSNQQVLIQPEPDFGPLREWVLAQIEREPVRWQALQRAVLAEDWRETHLNKMVGQLRRERFIEAQDYEGRFSAKANPLLVRRS